MFSALYDMLMLLCIPLTVCVFDLDILIFEDFLCATFLADFTSSMSLFWLINAARSFVKHDSPN